MSQMISTVARLLAYQAGRALLTRQSSALAADPQPAFGIAPIRMVSEQVIYAIAYGDLDGEPDVVLTWNPLDREARFLQPFAFALNEYLTACVGLGVLPRVWLPHPAALEVIELLGHRYRTNRGVGPELQLMGAQCRLLAEEALYPGQQLVAVAATLLAQHVATGQSPSEDQHLGALLAWVEPPGDIPVGEAAQRASYEPAAAMLERSVDETVEGLQEAVRAGRRSETAARAEAERLIVGEAQREWRLLVRAQRAFWGLRLSQGSELGRLVRESFDRIAWQVDRSLAAPSRPNTLASRFDTLTFANELSEYAAVVDDPITQERARRAGMVIDAVVVRREQPRPSFSPCTLVLETTQSVLRVRRGTTIQLRGTTIVGRVTAVSEADGGAATQLSVEITKGVRHPALTRAGGSGTWTTPSPVDLRWKRREVYDRMAARGDPRVFGEALPAGSPLTDDDELAAVARRLRR